MKRESLEWRSVIVSTRFISKVNSVLYCILWYGRVCTVTDCTPHLLLEYFLLIVNKKYYSVDFKTVSVVFVEFIQKLAWKVFSVNFGSKNDMFCNSISRVLDFVFNFCFIPETRKRYITVRYHNKPHSFLKTLTRLNCFKIGSYLDFNEINKE